MRAFYLSVFFIACFFWWSALSFFPLPWPDDSVFYLAGIDWIRSPSHYRMLSQSLFIPSYLDANFNTMPGLPLLFGVLYQLGVKTLHAARMPGVLAFAGYVCLLATWLRHRGLKFHWVILISLCALFDPIIRWGAMIIRPEVWQGLFFLVIILELDHFFKKRSTTRLSIALALAAYIHFQAVYWVPAVALSVLSDFSIPLKSRLKMLLETALKTLAWLSPWILYTLLHFNLFFEQMQVQFARLDSHNPFTSSLSSFFQSLYLGMFIPVSYPKFLNPVKVIFWLGLLVSVCFWAARFLRQRKIPDPVSVALFFALGFQFFLWLDKPETWFVMLIHMVYFPWIGIQIFQNGRWQANATLNRGVGFILILFLGLECVLAGYQIKKASPFYQWSRYDAWIDCIDQQIGNTQEVWQASYPDFLINLAGKNRDRSYYRANDFRPADIEERKTEALRHVGAIIHSVWMPIDSELIHRNYSGPPEKADLFYVTDYPWMPDAKWSAPHLGAPWKASICQNGPFWAMISKKE